MKKKVASVSVDSFEAITDEEVESILELIVEAQGAAGQTVALNAKARQTAPKMRRGGQQVVPTIAALATKHQIELPSLPVSDMTSRIAHATRLREVLSAVMVFEKLLQDGIFLSEGAAWATATATYAVMRRAAKSQPTLATELAPVVAWFRRPPPKAAPAAPVTEAPAQGAEVTAPKT